MAGPSASCVTSADISRMLLESDDDSGSKNFSESSDSNLDYAREENWNEADEMVLENVDDSIVAHDSDTQWMWCAIQTSYRGQKISFARHCGPQKIVESVLEACN